MKIDVFHHQRGPKGIENHKKLCFVLDEKKDPAVKEEPEARAKKKAKAAKPAPAPGLLLLQQYVMCV